MPLPKFFTVRRMTAIEERAKERIEENNHKIYKEYENQILLEMKIKELFKQDEIKVKGKRSYLNSDDLNSDNDLRKWKNNDKCSY